jgi:RNA polymerase sigma factor (sigma-70 family)
MGFNNINRRRGRVVSKNLNFFLEDLAAIAERICHDPMSAAPKAQAVFDSPGGGKLEPKLVPTDLGLLLRLRDPDDFAAWQIFHQVYQKLIHRAATRAGLPETEAEEVVQETMINAAQRMETYRYEPERCSFKGWLMYLTRRRIIDCLRKRRAQAPLRDAVPLELTEAEAGVEVADPRAERAFEAMWSQEWRDQVLSAAQRRVRCNVQALQYDIYERHCVLTKGCPCMKSANYSKCFHSKSGSSAIALPRR